jgi:addiction module RelE/StbE family toxin
VTVIVWTKPALKDVQALVDAWAEINPEIAAQVANLIRKAGQSLSDSPKRGAMVKDAPDVRKLQVPFGRSGFVIHYAVLEEEVVILRVYHGRQDRKT